MHTIHANLPFVLQLAIVADHNGREKVLPFHFQNLLVECANFLKRATGYDRVDEQEAFSDAHVLLTHSPMLTN